MNFARLFPHRLSAGSHILLLLGLLLATRPAGAAPTQAATIPWDQVGAKAQENYRGNGLSVLPGAGGAALRCVFQKLEGQVTQDGLSLSSTAEPVAGQPFRVMAQSVGRNGLGTLLLASTGKVETRKSLARFLRPGLVEEYSVSADGVRQDFLVTERPAGLGVLQMELAVAGATAEKERDGVQLVLTDSGRKLAYHRLKVTDARGQALKARMEVRSASRIGVVVEDAAAVYPIRIDPTFSDANWVSLGVPLGTDGFINAMIVDGADNLYVGGGFSSIGKTTAYSVARWDGTNWFALGDEFDNGVIGAVNAFALDSSGSLYVGGGFFDAGGTAANSIAKWDGSTWSTLGDGMASGVVNALEVDSLGNVYAGGEFSTAGTNTAHNVAKWDGTDWSPLGEGTDEAVTSLQVDASGNLYAGGYFTTAGVVTANSIAKWDGTDWSPLGAGMDDGVLTIKLDGSGNLYAGGYFMNAGTAAASMIAKWDGTDWSVLGDGVNLEVHALVPDAGGGLYVGGAFSIASGVPANRVAYWDGTNWFDIGGTDSDPASAVLAMTSDNHGGIYIGGSFITVDGLSVGSIAQRTGGAWRALGKGSDDALRALVADGSGNVYAGGYFTVLNGVSASHVAKWDGSAWSALGDGVDGPVFALLLDGAGNLYAGGGFEMAGGNSATNVAKWDGTNWSSLGDGMDNTVYALARNSSGTLYAGGEFENAGGSPASFIAQWNGMAWSPLGAGVNNSVRALAVDASDHLYAGGYFTSAAGGTVTANYIAQWDGSSWSALASDLNDRVFALAFDASGNLYAGGDFTEACGVTVNYIAKWDGSTWAALGGGMDDAVRALAFDADGNLYAGGYFYQAGGDYAYEVAQWSGSAWSALGSGMDDAVRALAVDSFGNLFLGGDFIYAGGTLSAYAAEYQFSAPGISVANGTNTLEDLASIVEFGAVPPGSNTFQSFTITNSGTMPLTGISFSLTGPNAGEFVVDDSATTNVLAPGEFTSFNVAFFPTNSGTLVAILRIYSNAGGDSSPFDIGLTGYIEGTLPAIVLDHSSILENQPANTVVGLLSATNIPPGDTVTFTLPCGCHDNNEFRIVGNELQARYDFDYEAQGSYLVIVHAHTSGGLDFEQELTILVENVNEFAPSFTGYSFTTPLNSPAKVALAKILARSFDQDLDVVYITGADTNSAQGGTVELLPTSVKYTPPVGFTGADSFHVTLNDGSLTTSAEVDVYVEDETSGNGATLLSITSLPPDVELKFAGIPGTHYLLQRSENLGVPVTWTTLTNQPANASGLLIYTDPSPPSPAYWRIIVAP